MEQVSQADQPLHVSRNERLWLLLPLAASAFVGLSQLLLPAVLASLTGYSGNDLYVYRLSGAATFGYSVALGLALRQSNWAEMRIVVIAFFTFGLASLYACGIDIVSGLAKPVVYVVLLLTIVFVAITGILLYTHRGGAKAKPNIANWVTGFIVIASVLAATFGLLPLLVPNLFSPVFGLKGTDVFIFRQAGAAALGYAVMGIFELRSRNWLEIRWPLVMAGVFNGLSFIASLLAFFAGSPPLLAYLVAPVSLGVTIAAIIAFRRQGA